MSNETSSSHLVPVHFEVCIWPNAGLRRAVLRERFEKYIATLPIVEDGELDVSNEKVLIFRRSAAFLNEDNSVDMALRMCLHALLVLTICG